MNEGEISSTNNREANIPAEVSKKVLKQQNNIKAMGDIEGISPAERLELAMEPLSGLIRDLAEGIKNNHWQILVGEDVSGRVPALVVFEVIKKYNFEHGLEPPLLYFVASGKKSISEKEGQRQENLEELWEYFYSHKDIAKAKHVLYITDTIHTGFSVSKSAEAMALSDIDFDIAALDPYIEADTENYLQSKGVKFYRGGEVDTDNLGNLYANLGKPALRSAIGVEKYGNEPLARTIHTKNSPAVADLRQQIKALAGQIYHEVF